MSKDSIGFYIKEKYGKRSRFRLKRKREREEICISNIKLDRKRDKKTLRQIDNRNAYIYIKRKRDMRQR